MRDRPKAKQLRSTSHLRNQLYATDMVHDDSDLYRQRIYVFFLVNRYLLLFIFSSSCHIQCFLVILQ